MFLHLIIPLLKYGGKSNLKNVFVFIFVLKKTVLKGKTIMQGCANLYMKASKEKHSAYNIINSSAALYQGGRRGIRASRLHPGEA